MIRRRTLLHHLLSALCAGLGILFVAEPVLTELHASSSGAQVTVVASSVLVADDAGAPGNERAPADPTYHICHCLHQHLACATEQAPLSLTTSTSNIASLPVYVTAPQGIRVQLLRPPIA